MEEIYWITRLDTIQGFCIGGLVIGFLLLFTWCMFKVCDEKSYSTLKWSGITSVFIFGLAVMFIPTSRYAMLIFGIGTTIDYIQNNETAKQLPDKCIKALDNWVETLNPDKNEKDRRD